ncbi:hypothetical protein E1B28_005712 [Marasmius oreades]|uniref:Malate dehydrogenase n=1 Tax=Marasmius oreades TaxID=181124 RepID=A0A9P7UVV5_9AGAR|nr:uncharacterized protein E1B28_005712 [Marasmius oreades]KAG7094906.1 hypothetical protein E1B28_005712 [Marasmius oreades]
MQLLSFIPLVLVAASFAAPAKPENDFACCKNVSLDDLSGLPAPQQPVRFLLLGVGTQNYTCSSAGTFSSAGAVAKLFDITCISSSPDFSKLTSDTYDLWTKAPPSTSAADAIRRRVDVRYPFGDHYFIASPSGTGISPKWDATSGAFNGNTQAFMIGAKSASVAAPTGSADVDWLYMTKVDGSLADEIYRTDTRGGQPLPSCTPGQSATVKYTALYYFTGGSV